VSLGKFLERLRKAGQVMMLLLPAM